MFWPAMLILGGGMALFYGFQGGACSYERSTGALAGCSNPTELLIGGTIGLVLGVIWLRKVWRNL